MVSCPGFLLQAAEKPRTPSRGGRSSLCFSKLTWPGAGDPSESYCDRPGKKKAVVWVLGQREAGMKGKLKVWKILQMKELVPFSLCFSTLFK